MLIEIFFPQLYPKHSEWNLISALMQLDFCLNFSLETASFAKNFSAIVFVIIV